MVQSPGVRNSTCRCLERPPLASLVSAALELAPAPRGLQLEAKKLKLAPGWKYRVKVLDQDLGIGAIDGTARIVQDDLEGTYNACFEANGKKNCTFKP
jgi:hypothetical protein